MPDLIVKGKSINVDIIAELEQFEWRRATWASDKLLACSPFREDSTPSFFVRLEPYGDLPAGVWHDSGAYDEEWGSGNFTKLLSYLREETYEEAEDYLLELYGFDEREGLRLPTVRLTVEQPRKPLNANLFACASGTPCPYLTDRGITEEVQRAAGIYHDSRKLIIPWNTPDGRLANVKYRSLHGKLFWYERGGRPIRELVWGIDRVNRKRAKVVILSEAEIDGMSWQVAGYDAIAIGKAKISREQVDIIKRSSIEKLIIAADNDEAGRMLSKQVEEIFSRYVELAKVDWSNIAEKDANEVLVRRGKEKLRELAAGAIGVNLALKV